MSSKFNKWYKETSERFTFNPPDGVWENIEHNLDIDDVWKRVSGELDMINRKNRIRKENMVLFSALFFLFTFYFIIENISVKESVHNIVSQQQQHRVNNALSPDISKTLSSESGINEATSEETGGDFPAINETGNQIAQNRSDGGGEGTALIQKDATSGLSSFRKLNPMKYELSDALNITPAHGDDYAVQYSQLNIKKQSPGIYFGLNFHLFNNWLVNDATISGLKTDDISETVLNFSQATSFSFGINSTERSGFRIDWIPNAKTGQSYNQYRDGEYLTSAVQLTYHHLNILHKRKLGCGRQKNDSYRSGNLLTGINLRFMQSAMEKTGNTLTNVSADYNNDDIGIYVGYEYERILFSNFMVSASINSQIGLTDIRKRDFSAPEYFNRTRNFSVGAMAGIRYAF